MSELRDQLTAFVRAHRLAESDVEVTEPVLLGGGSSKTNWAFDVRGTTQIDGRAEPTFTEMILRQEPISGVVETRLADEYALLRAIRATATLAPTAFWLDANGDYFDRPSMVGERAPGRADRSVLRARDPLGLGAVGQIALAAELAGLLAAVHAADLTTVADVLPDPGPSPAATELARWEDELDRLGGLTALAPVRAWLRDRMPDPPKLLHLVHGDFRPANVLVENGRISALLDWELAHLGDACDDLGWYTCSIYRKEHFPEGWSVEDLLARYVRVGGRAPEPERLRFWQVLSVFRLAVIATRAARNIEHGLVEGTPPPVDRVIAQALADINDA